MCGVYKHEHILFVFGFHLDLALHFANKSYTALPGGSEMEIIYRDSHKKWEKKIYGEKFTN